MAERCVADFVSQKYGSIWITVFLNYCHRADNRKDKKRAQQAEARVAQLEKSQAEQDARQVRKERRRQSLRLMRQIRGHFMGDARLCCVQNMLANKQSAGTGMEGTSTAASAGFVDAQRDIEEQLRLSLVKAQELAQQAEARVAQLEKSQSESNSRNSANSVANDEEQMLALVLALERARNAEARVAQLEESLTPAQQAA